MPDIEGLKASVNSILESMRSFVETASDLAWSPSDGYLPIIRRATMRRQFDSLEAIAHMVAEKRGYAAAPLLRPACEELIWIKYLAVIPLEDAEKLIECLAYNERLDSLRKQDEYAGRGETQKLGLLPYLTDAEARNASMQERVRELGTKLGWEPYAIEGGKLPSPSWVAKKTGQTKLYKFIYHATSRFVHFSAAELLRRAWAAPGRVSVRSIHFRDYWSAFALSWGLSLFLDTFIEVCGTAGMPEVGLDEPTLLAAAEWIGKFGQVPIISAEELEWPS